MMTHHKLISFLFILVLSTESIVGQQWKRIVPPPTGDQLTHDVIVLPNGVLAVGAHSGVWVTPDKGTTWTRTFDIYSVSRIRGTKSLFALGNYAVHHPVPSIYASNETGTIWANIATDSIQRHWVEEITARSSTESFVLATDFGSSPMVYSTTNGGVTWHSVSSSEAPYFATMWAGPGKMLYGVHSTDGFYRSTDNGASWTLSNSGITTASFSSIVGKGEDTLFLPSSNGTLYRSTNKGLSWQSITNAFPDTSTLLSLCISSTGVLYLAAKTDFQSTINQSSDNGVTWSRIGDPINSANLWSIAITPEGTVVARVDFSDLFTNDSTFVTTGVDEAIKQPIDFQLHQNYPNPFNPSTTITIEYDVSQRSHVRLIVFDILGREVAKLVDEDVNVGTHSLSFLGRSLSSGIYFYRLETVSTVFTKRMILEK